MSQRILESGWSRQFYSMVQDNFYYKIIHTNVCVCVCVCVCIYNFFLSMNNNKVTCMYDPAEEKEHYQDLGSSVYVYVSLSIFLSFPMP